MTARPSQPPLSRRELRQIADVASDATQADDAGQVHSGESASITASGGRRVRWDPATAGAPAPIDGSAAPVPSAPVGDAATDEPVPPASTFRQRDHRQDGRRASFAPAFVAREASDRADVPSVGDGSGTDQAMGIGPAPSERTMTRRELRILRARAEAAGMPAPDVVFGPNGESTVTGAIPILDGDAFRHSLAPTVDPAGVVTGEPSSDQAVDAIADATPVVIPALVEPDPTGGARFPAEAEPAHPEIPAEIVVDAEPATGDHPLSDIVVEQPGPMPGTEESDPPAPGRLRPFDAMFLSQSARVDDDRADPVLDTSSSQPANDGEGLRGDILAAPPGAPRPFGHWSTQDQDDDGSSESAISRDVSTGVVTTHALVLPSIPDAGEPLLSPLTSTGEVMVTGIVELPKSYGSTGAHPALFDHPEVDSLIDDADREDANSGAAPVRATRAVSSTTTTRSMVETAPTKRSRILPIAAIIVGGIVLVAAASWAIAAIFFNAF